MNADNVITLPTRDNILMNTKGLAMPFVLCVPEKVAQRYMSLAEKYNDPLTSKTDRDIAYWQSSGLICAMTDMGFAVGLMLMDADMKCMENYGEEAEMCGGFLSDPEQEKAA